MRAYKFLSLDGKEAVMVGTDGKLPPLDASLLVNVEKTIKAKSPEILSVIPTELTETDIGRVFIYVGNEVGYEKYATYVIEYSEEVYSITKISASLDFVGLPSVTVDDNNKILVVLEGAWAKADITTELPVVTTDDNNKVLTVVAGAWATADLPAETIELPVVTVADNDKILTVVNGAWTSGTAPVGVTTASVQTALSINTSTGSLVKVLSEKGTFVDLTEMSGSGGLSITRQRFARPYFDAATHLVIQAAQALDFSDAETIIDTENVEADRGTLFAGLPHYARVIIWMDQTANYTVRFTQLLSRTLRFYRRI